MRLMCKVRLREPANRTVRQDREKVKLGKKLCERGKTMFREEANALRQELEEIYKDLHRHPEIGYMEFRTAKIVANYLKKLGLEVTEGVALTGVVGVLDSGRPGKTLMLRADMDCLRIQERTGCAFQSEEEGMMHACGHDAHVAMLLGAAKVLSRHKEAFDGKIKFVFQPSEEGTDLSVIDKVRAAGYMRMGGAGFMVQLGVLDDVDACAMIHNQPKLPTGSVQIARRNACASSNIIDITIKGKGGHGAKPHECIDPVPAMAEIINGINMIPSREINCTESCVISIGTIETPGSVWNAVPDRIRLRGGFRAFSIETRDYIGNRIIEIVETIGKAHRCEVEATITHSCIPCLNDPHMAELAAESCREIFGAEHVDLTDAPVMTSEDAGEYLIKIPGVLMWLGSGDPDHELHNPEYLPNLDILPQGVEVHVSNAIHMLADLNK